MSGDYMLYMLIAGGLSMLGAYVSNKLKSKFQYYSQINIRANLSGREVAEKMLQHYGISNVKIVQGKGFLSDHYNPMSKTVSLSPEVYQGRSIASAAVAAHECGHAIQHATSYPALAMRSGLVPLVKVASMAQQWLLMFAFVMINTMPSIMLITIIAFGVTCLFSLITLPVEFDASKRALVWLEEKEVLKGQEYEGGRDALKWAAMTYVSAALSSLVMLLYLVFRYTSSRR